MGPGPIRLLCRENYRLVYRGTAGFAQVAFVCQSLHLKNSPVTITGYNGTAVETVQVCVPQGSAECS